MRFIEVGKLGGLDSQISEDLILRLVLILFPYITKGTNFAIAITYLELWPSMSLIKAINNCYKKIKIWVRDFLL